MVIKCYEDMNSTELDIMKEIGSIGTGNAVTALSSLMNVPVSMELPDIAIEKFNQAIKSIGHAEEMVAGILVMTEGDLEGMMMILMDLDFVNCVMGDLIGKHVDNLHDLDELGISALTEVGNIMISSYLGAISTLTGMKIDLMVPEISVNMMGGIVSVPMVQMGYESDSIMMIKGSLGIGDKKYNNNILMFPDIESLNRLINKLVLCDE